MKTRCIKNFFEVAGSGWPHSFQILTVFLGSMLVGAAPIPALSPPFDFEQAEWEKVSGKHQDIEVYRWKAPGEELFAFKGVGVVDAPIPKVVSVITDLSRQQEWVPDFGGVRLIEQVNPLHRIHYLHIKTPFVIKDRDFVIEGRAFWNEERKEVRLEFASVSHVNAPKTDRVRGEILKGAYLLRAAESGRKTEALLQVYLDPKGTVPRWLVNATQRNYPKRMIEAIRRQVAKADIVEHPWARAAMEGRLSEMLNAGGGSRTDSIHNAADHQTQTASESR